MIISGKFASRNTLERGGYFAGFMALLAIDGFILTFQNGSVSSAYLMSEFVWQLSEFE